MISAHVSSASPVFSHLDAGNKPVENTLHQNGPVSDSAAPGDILAKIDDHWKRNENNLIGLLFNIDKQIENPFLFQAYMHQHSEFVGKLSAVSASLMGAVKNIQQVNGG